MIPIKGTASMMSNQIDDRGVVVRTRLNLDGIEKVRFEPSYYTDSLYGSIMYPHLLRLKTTPIYFDKSFDDIADVYSSILPKI